MARSILIGLVAAAALAGSSAAWALPAAPQPHGTNAVQVQYYPPCPPGYKVTSHGACKLSHYLRKHPEQNPNNYYGEPRPGYGYWRPHRRFYYQDDY